MSGIEKLKARLGGNIRESMSIDPAGTAPGSLPGPGGVLAGGEKFKGTARVRDALAIRVEQIAPDPDQPRKEFDERALDDLAASLKARGQLQPIRVRWEQAMGRWIVIAGERRYRAAIRAGLPTLMCVEATGPQTPDDILEDQLVENCLREDLKPIEQARAFRALIDRRGWSYRQLSEHLHVAPASVARALALLELPEDLQGRVEAGELAPSVAYEVSRLRSPDDQREVAARVVSEDLSRAEAVEAVRQAAGRSTVKRGGRAAIKARPRRPTVRTFKATSARVTVEFKRAADPAEVLAALREVVAKLEAEQGGDQAAA
jgi:ParB family chromosome partitioning protein